MGREGVHVVKAGASMRSKDRAASFYTWVRYAADNIELSRQYAVWRLWTYDLMPLYKSLYYYIIIIIYSFLFTKSGSNINNDKNNRKHNYQQLVKYYSSLQKWQKPFTVKIYRNLNLSCLLLRTQLGRSIAKQLRIFYYIRTPSLKKVSYKGGWRWSLRNAGPPCPTENTLTRITKLGYIWS